MAHIWVRKAAKDSRFSATITCRPWARRGGLGHNWGEGEGWGEGWGQGEGWGEGWGGGRLGFGSPAWARCHRRRRRRGGRRHPGNCCC
eukprot:3999677-Prymnesium_polylepis.1